MTFIICSLPSSSRSFKSSHQENALPKFPARHGWSGTEFIEFVATLSMLSARHGRSRVEFIGLIADHSAFSARHGWSRVEFIDFY